MRGVTYSVMQKLATYSWPGNVRELKNTMHRLCVLAGGELIDTVDLPASPAAAQACTSGSSMKKLLP